MARSDRKLVYLNEYNVRMGQTTYLPFVSGILRACAEQTPAVRDAYAFAPFIFFMDAFDSVIRHYDEPPDVAAFSISMWNENLSLEVARWVKERWPECLVVFGGAQMPHQPKDYFERHPFIDVGVRAEGEEAFVGILERFLESRDFRGIPNVSFRDPNDGGFVGNVEAPAFERDLDIHPSPYLTGIFDGLFARHSDLTFQAIIETNRGCPFQCTFCYWGKGGLSRKYRYHSRDRVRAELDWCGRHEIRYVFNADSNFGMHKRDFELATDLVRTKQRYGFPEKFRTCWGKNTDENIFRIARLLCEHNLEKGVTLARQSNSKPVLANIKRGNIKLETYADLQHRFNEVGIPVYSEMILGLPGETYESWRDGLEALLEAGLKNQLFVYQCEVYPNTEMADPAYQRAHGIRLQKILLREIHGSVRDDSWVPEYQDIIIETKTMSVADWRRMTGLATVTMLMHSLKLGFFVIGYLHARYGIGFMRFSEYVSRAATPLLGREMERLEGYLDGLLEGSGRGVELPHFGNIYWDIEEAMFLSLAENLDGLYEELHGLAEQFLLEEGIVHDREELAEVLRYQRLRIPAPDGPASPTRTFRFNLPEYFDRLLGKSPVPLTRSRQTLTLETRDFAGNPERYAREVILWGRKSGTIETKCRWEDAAA